MAGNASSGGGGNAPSAKAGSPSKAGVSGGGHTNTRSSTAASQSIPKAQRKTGAGQGSIRKARGHR